MHPLLKRFITGFLIGILVGLIGTRYDWNMVFTIIVGLVSSYVVNGMLYG